jgi:hypothetical protein
VASRLHPSTAIFDSKWRFALKELRRFRCAGHTCKSLQEACQALMAGVPDLADVLDFVMTKEDQCSGLSGI